MLNPASPLARLFDAPMRPGRVEWIGVRPARHAELAPQAAVNVAPDGGLPGDHYRSASGRRQVTLIGQADLDGIASFLGLASVSPLLLRRNIVTSGVNLVALKGRRLRVGDAVLEVTGECHPCSRMEAILGPGGYNAVRAHGGVTASVVAGGAIRLGDAVVRD